MPLLDIGVIELYEAKQTKPEGSNANAVFCVLEGMGRTVTSHGAIGWKRNDVFCVPQGNTITHTALSETAKLFTVSDKEVYARLGLLQNV